MDIEKLVRLIREFLREQAKPPDARPPEEEFRKGVQELLANFERRALEVDGDQAPRGLDAVQERYYSGARVS